MWGRMYMKAGDPLAGLWTQVFLGRSQISKISLSIKFCTWISNLAERCVKTLAVRQLLGYTSKEAQSVSYYFQSQL